MSRTNPPQPAWEPGRSFRAAVDAMGERWSLLIMLAAFGGTRHFEDFQTKLGIARNILANRLARLVSLGILERQALPIDRRKIVYIPTAKGRALVPALLALQRWGAEWEAGTAGEPVLADLRDRQPVAGLSVRSHDGRDLAPDGTIWIVPSDTE